MMRLKLDELAVESFGVGGAGAARGTTSACSIDTCLGGTCWGCVTPTCTSQAAD